MFTFVSIYRKYNKYASLYVFVSVFGERERERERERVRERDVSVQFFFC